MHRRTVPLVITNHMNRHQRHDEFEKPEAVDFSRRSFLKLSGFTFAGTVLAGCTQAQVDKAIPFLLASEKDLKQVAREIPRDVKILAEKFWPGALTLVVPAHSRVPRILIAYGDSVAVRVPNSDVTRALIKGLGAPLAATSANISSQPDPQTAEETAAYLNERIPLILDGGATPGNIPSTVLDLTTEPPTVRRVGAIAPEEIELALGRQLK